MNTGERRVWENHVYEEKDRYGATLTAIRSRMGKATNASDWFSRWFIDNHTAFRNDRGVLQGNHSFAVSNCCLTKIRSVARGTRSHDDLTDINLFTYADPFVAPQGFWKKFRKSPSPRY